MKKAFPEKRKILVRRGVQDNETAVWLSRSDHWVKRFIYIDQNGVLWADIDLQRRSLVIAAGVYYTDSVITRIRVRR